MSKILVKQLVPELIEHFRPPTPPKQIDRGISAVIKTSNDGTVTASCFRDFRKAGIDQRKQIRFSSWRYVA